MVAVALLSLGIVVLLQVQARSIQLAQQARNLSVATGLARAKLYDCEQDLRKKGFSIGDYDEEGRFEEKGFESFFWECHAYKPELPVPDATEITQGLTGAASSAAASSGASSSIASMASAGDAAGMGASMLAPVLGQVSQVVGESIRELVVIVKWREGELWEDLRVTTHLVDRAGIQQMAAGLGAMGGGMSGLPAAAPPPELPEAGGVPGLPGQGAVTPRGAPR